MPRMLQALRSFEELTLYEIPPMRALRALPTLKAVRLREASAPKELVAAFGELVIEIASPYNIYDEAGVSGLDSCLGLQVLLLKIKEGAEARLFEAFLYK